MTSSLYLNVGCGKVKLPGFVNIDLEPGGDIQCDVTQGLPYADATVDGIYSEHFIEHLSQKDILGFLRECRRVLKPGGRARIATPDLDAIITQFTDNNWRQPWLEKYGYQWIKNRAEYLNVSLREWGHAWVVDEEELSRLASWAGLERLQRVKLNESTDPHLSGLETRLESTLIMEYVRAADAVDDQPLVSIVIPAYRADFLAACLDSALAQTHHQIEILVLDDSPSDAVARICGAYAQRDPRVTYRRNAQPLGEPENLTQGIRLARGEFIKPLYDDDLLAPDAVEQLLAAWRAHPGVRLAAVRRLPMDAAGQPLDEALLPPLSQLTGRLRGTEVLGHILARGLNLLGEPTCMMFRRSDALAIDEPNVMSLFGHLCVGVGDVCLALHMLSRGDLAYVADPLAKLRIHSAQTQRQQQTHTLGMANWQYLRQQGARLGIALQPQPPSPIEAGAVPLPTPALSDSSPEPSLIRSGRPLGSGTAVLLHLFYPDLWAEFLPLLRSLPKPFDVYISLSEGREDLLADIARDLPDATVIRHPNRGRDIAPRLALLRMARAQHYDQLLFLHGKKSPHLREIEHIHIPFLQHKDGNRWRQELLADLLASPQRVIATFAQNPRVGLIGPHGFWLELRGDANVPRLAHVAQRMGIAPDLARHGYFAGSMFWCRPQALDPLLALDLKAGDFEDEAGQTDATLAHVVERLFTLSTERAGFEVCDTAGTTLAAPPRLNLPWLPEDRWAPREQDWAQQAMTAWRQAGQVAPRIALALAANADFPPQPSRASLAAQWLAAQPLIELPADLPGDAFLSAANPALLGSDGDWLGLMDAGDQLAPDALFRVSQALRAHPQWQLVYTDEDQITPDGQHLHPHCKPDFNLDYLRSLPYIGGLLLIRRDLFEALGGFNRQAEGAEDYDLLLRAWEHLQQTGAGEAAIGHVPEVLYHRLQGSGHTQKSVPEILAAGHAALERHFARLGIAAQVQPGPFPPSFRVRWPLPEIKPLVSILIPTRDQLPLLQRCVESVIEKTKYPAYEILIIDNDSQTAEARNYLAAIETKEAELGGRLRVVRQPGPFNFSAMNNAAAKLARGDFLLLLNNDTAALHDDWLDDMMGHAVRPDVGIVGAKLLYPDGKIQHAGVILGMRGPAEHPFIGRPPEDRGYFGRAQLTQNLSAVTGACLLIRKSVYEQLDGLDEQAFKVSYNDIDLCLKVREAGLRIVFTPYALLMHEGSASQKGGTESKPDEAKLKRFAAEKDAMYAKWLPQLAFDPAYNRHLSLASTDFLLEDQPPLSWGPAWRPRPRVLVHPADRDGCGEYRIIAPMRALNRAGLTQGWETMRLYEPAEMERMQPDSLVVQRQMEWPQIEALECHARTSRAFRVFEIDDLITNLPHKSVHKSTIHKDIAKRFRKAASLCNRLVVATEPLAKAYAHFSDEVVVQPNYLEAARWAHLQPARAERSKPRVGWAGGVGHTGDLDLIADLVRDTAAEVDWVFFGMCPESLKPLVKEFHTGVPLDQYPAKLAALDLDLAVAPLEDNAFNEAKSHLRLLEYGILGYPVICSDLTPYQGPFPVTRVANRYRDWTRALREAVSDRAALRDQGDALRATVRRDWMMEDHLESWLKAWLP
ncbi:glycosyltransferase [Thiomonas intermedia]|uniref:glycosyltransferase n=1 Tax=Thiomonas intermedia TaxID=926 RepID=UPI0014730004|nr:glycosyltransferase [Thiomonas intermedia]